MMNRKSITTLLAITVTVVFLFSLASAAAKPTGADPDGAWSGDAADQDLGLYFAWENAAAGYTGTSAGFGLSAGAALNPPTATASAEDPFTQSVTVSSGTFTPYASGNYHAGVDGLFYTLIDNRRADQTYQGDVNFYSGADRPDSGTLSWRIENDTHEFIPPDFLAVMENSSTFGTINARRADNTEVMTASDRFTLTIENGANVTAPDSKSTNTFGATLDYTVTVNNNSSTYEQNFDLSATDTRGWTISFSPDNLLIPAENSATSTMSVTVQGGSDDITISADSSLIKEDNTSCTANGPVGPQPVVDVSPDSQEGFPGDSLTYTVEVQNGGSVDDNYTLNITDDGGLTASLSGTTLVGLAPGDTRTVDLNVTIPSGASFGDHTITVQAVSEDDNTVTDNDSVTVTVNPPVGVNVDNVIPDDVKSGQMGEWVCFPIEITNSGSAMDNIGITLSDTLGWDLKVGSAPVYTTITEIASADSEVNEAYPENTDGGEAYGDDIEIGAVDSVVDNVARGYFQFDLSSIPDGATIVSANMELYTYYGGENQAYDDETLWVSTKEVSDDSWGEFSNQLTWGNAPLMGSTIDTVKVTPADSTIYSWDVASYIQGELADGTASIGLMSENEDKDKFVPFSPTSNWYSNPEPKLEITYVTYVTDPASEPVDVAGSLVPTDDSYITDDDVNANNGSGYSIYAGTYFSTGENQRGYFQFNLPAGLDSITSAELLDYTYSGAYSNPTPISALDVSDDSWDESTITWSNAPTMGSTLDTVTVGTGGDENFYWDVTSFASSELAGDGIVSLGLISEDEGVTTESIGFNSKERPSYYSGPIPQLLYEGTSEGWSIPVAAGDTVTVYVCAQIPPGANYGDVAEDITVNATSQSSPGSASDSTSVSINEITQAEPTENRAVEVVLSPDNQTAHASVVDTLINPSVSYNPVTFRVTVKNEGILDDKYKLSVDDTDEGRVADWGLRLDDNELFVPAGDTAFTSLSVTVPSEVVGNMTHDITVTAEGTMADEDFISENAEDSENVTVTAGHAPDVQVELKPGTIEPQTGAPGSPLTWLVVVKNTGNENNVTITLENSEIGPWNVAQSGYLVVGKWGVSLDESSFENVAAGATRTTYMRTTVPDDARTAENNSFTVDASYTGASDSYNVDAEVLEPGPRIPLDVVEVSVEAEVVAIDVYPEEWDFGVMDEGATESTAGDYFTIRNTGNIDETIKVKGTDAKSMPDEPNATWELADVIGIDTYTMSMTNPGVSLSGSYQTAWSGLGVGDDDTFGLEINSPSAITTPAKMWARVKFLAVAA